MKIFAKKLVTAFLLLGIATLSVACNSENTDKNTQSSALQSETPKNTGSKTSDGNTDTGKNSTDNFLIYSNEEYSFKLSYPKEWTKYDDAMGTLVAFVAPKDGENDPFSENINVVVQDLSSQTVTLDQYVQASEEEIKQYISNADIISSKKTKLGENNAYKLVFSGEQGIYRIKWMQIYVVKNNFAYVFTFTAEDSQYDKYISQVEEIMNSIEL